jgi:homoserine dehydrogenase
MVAPLRVGIAGLGTVGAEVVRLIESRASALASRCGRPVRVIAVTARTKAKKRSLDLRGIAWAKDPHQLAENPDVDCLVELIGGAGEPALSAIETALKAGKSVVTANKALIAKHGLRLAKAAEAHGATLNFEAAVGAAIPIVKTLREGLAGTSINRVYGILNGTCNYILTRMEKEGLSFDECLKDAQRLGYAEADPSFDVAGQQCHRFRPRQGSALTARELRRLAPDHEEIELVDGDAESLRLHKMKLHAEGAAVDLGGPDLD